MATIERKPLPPHGRGTTTIAPSERIDLTNRARDVIDYYMSGDGSWWGEGTRKPLDRTIEDLQGFKSAVIASEQFASDPDSILASIKKMIDDKIYQVDQAIQRGFGRDDIRRTPPDTNDGITIQPPPVNVPAARNTAPARRAPIFAPAPASTVPPDPSQSASSQRSSSSAQQLDSSDIRVLGRFTRAPDGSLVPAPLGVQTQQQTRGPRPFNDRPLTNFVSPSSISNLPDQSSTAGSMDDRYARWIKALVRQ